MLRSRLSWLVVATAAFGACGDSAEPPPAGDDASSTTASATDSGTSAPTTAADDATGPATTASASTSTGSEPLPPEYCPAGVEPSLELGHGEMVFTPVDDDIAQIIHGHQGGYHVVLGLRGRGFDLSDWGDGHLRATVGGNVVADHTTIVVMNCDEGGDYSEALWINLIFKADVEQIRGQLADVEATFSDVSGQSVTAHAQFQISESIEPL